MKRKKHGNMLRKKLYRDILSGWKSFVSVLIICTLSMTLYCGIYATAQGMQKNLDAQFARCNMADIWVHGELSDRKVKDIANLPGVMDTQRRTVLRAKVQNLANEPKLDVYMSDGNARINRPMIMEGNAFPEGEKNLCIINEAFAKANGLHIGDKLMIEYAGMKLELSIHAIGHQAEYVVYSDGASIMANAQKFGYATVSPGTLSMLPFTQTSVTLKEGVDAEQAKQDIEELLDDKTKKITLRKDSVGIRMAIEEVEQIHALGRVFPVIFFLVAALITWSTMKRLVENQRQQIGTLRSLGYGKYQLIWHYTSFGLWIAVISSILGLLLSELFLARVIINLLQSIYVLPGVAPYMEPWVGAGASALLILIASGASFISCRRSLKETPSMLLRPKSPAKARRVFLEYVPFIWKHLSFSNKMVIRNIQRNASRFLIGLLGVTGCTALLLTGFGMKDSVKYVMDNHYGNTMRYDVRVVLDEPNLPDDYLDTLRKRVGADRMESIMESTAEIWLQDKWKSESIYVVDNQPIMINMRGMDGNISDIPQTGALITEKFSEETGVTVGDTLRIRTRNGKTGDIRVEKMVTMQLGQGVYMGRAAWRKLDIAPYSPTALMLQGDAAKMDISAIEDFKGVNVIRTLDEEKASNGLAVQVMDLVVMLMVLFSGALALVVLYTLGQLNFFERKRELATLMVLGFYPRENKKVILRENMIIALLGIPLGLLAGPYVHMWVLETGLPNTLEFIPYIAKASWIYTPTITILYAVLVNLLVGGKFKKVDMVEALKSVE